MPLLQRSSSSASLKLWEKQGTKSNNFKQQGGKKSTPKSSKSSLSSSLLLATDDYNPNNPNPNTTMGLFATDYGQYRRPRSYSNTRTTTSRSRSKSHQRYYYEGSNNFSIPIFSTESEGIEAILPPSTKTSTSMRPRRSTSKTDSDVKNRSHSGGKKHHPQQTQTQQQQQQQQQQHISQASSKWHCLTPFSAGTFSKRNSRQNVPPVLTATSSSDDSKQERFDLSFDQKLHPEWDYAFDAELWNQKQDPQNVLESSRVDTTFASISSASSSSSPHPEPVVLSHHDPHDSTAHDRDGTKKKTKWKKRIFFWRQPHKNKQHTDTSIDHHDHHHLHRSTHNSNKANHNRIASQNENDTSWRDNAFRVDSRSDHNHKERDRDHDEQPIFDSILWQTGMNDGEQAVECEYRGDIGVRDWFANSSEDDDKHDDGIQPSCSFSVLGLDLDETTNHNTTTIDMMMIMNHNDNNTNNHGGGKNSSLGEEEESLIDADDLTRNTSSVVMELGQYAREMQSKVSAGTPSPPPRSKSSFPKPATPSRLLCALPGLGSKLLNISNRSNKDNKDNEFSKDRNFPDPEENWPDYESDNNSYLAVSYTEECAQLVMQQSDELTRDLQRMAEEQRLAAAAAAALACEDDDDEDNDEDDGDDDIGHIHHHLYDSSPDSSPQGYVGHDDTGYMEEDGVDDSSTFRTADAEDVIRNDLDYLMQRRSSRSSQSKNNPTGGSSSNLGASFPHPAAQLRDDFVLQLSAQRQLKHPSPFTSTEDDDEESAPGVARTNLRQDIDNVARTVMGARNSLRSFQGTPEVTTGPQIRHFSIQDRAVKGRQETFSRTRSDPPSNSSSSVHTPPPIRTMRSNLLERNKDKDEPQKQPWVLQRRDDPPGWSNGVARPHQAPTRTFRYGRCLTTTNMSSYGPACTGNGVPMWEFSEPKETNWDGKNLRTVPTQKTLSTLSTSSDKTYPLEERKAIATSDFWGIYQPIHNAAKGVSQSLCENVYARKEQPATVPFDEWEEDDNDYRGRRSWAPAGASISSSSKVASYYESSYRYGRDEQSCSTDPISWPPDESTEHDSYCSHVDSTPDPELVLPEHRDTRRQLL